MNRRYLLKTLGPALLLGSAPAYARAASTSPGGKEAEVFDMRMMGFPIIREGRLVNYVFVNLKLHLNKNTRAETVQAKEPALRDALVRAGHATPFVMDGDDRQLNIPALTSALQSHADRLMGSGSVIRVEVVNQMSRNR